MDYSSHFPEEISDTHSTPGILDFWMKEGHTSTAEDKQNQYEYEYTNSEAPNFSFTTLSETNFDNFSSNVNAKSDPKYLKDNNNALTKTMKRNNTELAKDESEDKEIGNNLDQENRTLDDAAADEMGFGVELEMSKIQTFSKSEAGHTNKYKNVEKASTSLSPVKSIELLVTPESSFIYTASSKSVYNNSEERHTIPPENTKYISNHRIVQYFPTEKVNIGNISDSIELTSSSYRVVVNQDSDFVTPTPKKLVTTTSATSNSGVYFGVNSENKDVLFTTAIGTTNESNQPLGDYTLRIVNITMPEERERDVSTSMYSTTPNFKGVETIPSVMPLRPFSDEVNFTEGNMTAASDKTDNKSVKITGNINLNINSSPTFDTSTSTRDTILERNATPNYIRNDQVLTAHMCHDNEELLFSMSFTLTIKINVSIN